MGINTREQGLEFVAKVFETLAHQGPEAAYSLVLSLGRTELQIVFSGLLSKYAELFSEHKKLEESATKLLQAYEESTYKWELT